MNREEIFRAIHKSGLGAYITYDSLVQLKYDECLERFASLVAAHVREECAKLCDKLQNIPATEPRHCAEDIRARSEK